MLISTFYYYYYYYYFKSLHWNLKSGAVFCLPIGGSVAGNIHPRKYGRL